ncbi:TIGR02757 family protein [uncultured Treponema sp.]|uniref:TIGR02757 family protein n=1 Tax=uncultured Treponema sp. TaxID=162155 RepID=UPI0025D0812C|nr:TIGR02757 family protein [uncultured Treponema sp.]
MHGRTDELNSSSTSSSFKVPSADSKSVSTELAEKLIQLAQTYETADFLKKDPSQFMHRFSKVRDVEAVAFISANLAFGRRDQILSHVEQILTAAGSSPAEWILSQKYNDFFPENEVSFYRMYTNHDMRLFFDGLRGILENSDTIGDFFKNRWEQDCSSRSQTQETAFLHQIIASAFDPKCKLLPHSKDSAAKKVNMLLRWLVRLDSPVDLGLWTWFEPKNLLMPLDTHVMQQSNNLGLISSKSANLRTAIELTKKVAEVFPDDPVKADFALFGLGVS